MINTPVTYEVGSHYREPDEEPPVDSVGLFIEGIPIYKIWYAAPVDVECSCLEGTCTHIGLVPPSEFPGGMPAFLFRDTSGHSLLVRAPLTATQEQVQHWASADSNGFMFLLIERGSQIVRQIRIVGVAEDFRRELKNAWLSVQHPMDLEKVHGIMAGMNDQIVMSTATMWAYNPNTDFYERI